MTPAAQNTTALDAQQESGEITFGGCEPTPAGEAAAAIVGRITWADEDAMLDFHGFVQEQLAALTQPQVPSREGEAWQPLSRLDQLLVELDETPEISPGIQQAIEDTRRAIKACFAAAPDAVGEALRRALKAMESVTVFVTSKERIKRPEGEEWWQEEIAALAAVADRRSFPQAGDGRPISDTAAELFGAGCDPETASFAARQLERKGLVLAPAVNAAEIETRIGGAYEMPDGRTFWIDGPVAREIARRASLARASSREGGAS